MGFFSFFYYSNLEVTFILRDEDNVGVDPSVFKRFVREEIEEEEEEEGDEDEDEE